ncbi:MAG: hypothetical protein N3D20_03250 [Candidatus Pacearchaeota archaeon]|nr:hypothetical protein [Candidatus Pacearchaeota archaeon]
MAEEVYSGGLKGFRYDKNTNYKLDNERKNEIEEAYKNYYERKERERKQRIMWWVIGILIGLIILGFLVYKFV